VAIWIGTDEAGYGPNLGPLVIAATVWEVPDDTQPADAYDLLQAVVDRAAHRDGRLAIADSKSLYKPGSGLANLEATVLACLLAAGHSVTSWRELWRVLVPRVDDDLNKTPWYAQFDHVAPVAVAASDVERAGERLTAGLQACGVRLLAIEAAAVFPARFNQLVAECDTKGGVLSRETVELVRRRIEPLDAAAVLVQCDKHGGRNRYGPLLQTVFPDYLVEVRCEGRAESAYRWGPADRRVEIRFTARGESFLPAALASMTAKYLRELAMMAFNRFWANHLPGLRPTAGYPLDARRFLTQISGKQQELGISDGVLWRCR